LKAGQTLNDIGQPTDETQYLMKVDQVFSEKHNLSASLLLDHNSQNQKFLNSVDWIRWTIKDSSQAASLNEYWIISPNMLLDRFGNIQRDQAASWTSAYATGWSYRLGLHDLNGGSSQGPCATGSRRSLGGSGHGFGQAC
jgi:hypothetical protein